MLHRRAGSIEALVLDAIRQLTDEEIRNATGRDRPHFYRVASPADDKPLRFDHAAGLDAALMAKGASPMFAERLVALTSDVLARLGGKGAGPRLDFATGLMRLAEEVGQLNGAVARAIEDNKLTPRELYDIADEAQDVIKKATAVRDAALERAESIRAVRDAAEPPAPVEARR